MYKGNSKIGKSINQPLDKENIAESLNNLPRNKLNMSTNNFNAPYSFILAEEKPLKRLSIDNPPEVKND
jgi:hypothetical protein